MEGCGNRVSCRNLCKKLQIMPLTSQYTLFLLMFLVQNKNVFSTNNENHILDTRQRNNLFLPQANLNIYQKGAYYSRIKCLILNPCRLRMLLVTKKKTCSEKKLLYSYSFYATEDYLCQLWTICSIIRFL